MKKSWSIKYIVVVILFVIWVFLQFIIGFTFTPTGSMSPTIAVGEHLSDISLCSKIAYKSSEPQRGDIIVFWSDELDDYLCKRVIGLPNETVSFKNGYVYIDGVLLDESSYLGVDVETNCVDTFTIPNGSYFCLGDNRENSVDSRFWLQPYVSKSQIYMKVLKIFKTNF